MMPQVNSARVSVVVPAYSRVHYLRECLASIRAQTIPDWECIVVDDCSPAGEAIREAVEGMEDVRFRYIRRNRNGGPAAARNTGIQAARATFFLCVDEDDRLVPEAAEILLQELASSAADAVCPQARLFGGVHGTRKAVEPTLQLLLNGMYLLPNGWIMRRDLWEKVGGYDEDPRLIGRDDWEIWLRILASGGRVRVIDRVLYELRTPAGGVGQPGSLEHEARAREVKCMRYVMRKHARLYQFYPHCRRAVLLRSIRIERDWHQAKGHRYRAAWLAVQLAYYDPNAKEIRKAVRLLLSALVGVKAAEKVGAWARALRMRHS